MTTAAVLIEHGWKPNYEDIIAAISAKNIIALIWYVPLPFLDLPSPVPCQLTHIEVGRSSPLIGNAMETNDISKAEPFLHTQDCCFLRFRTCLSYYNGTDPSSHSIPSHPVPSIHPVPCHPVPSRAIPSRAIPSIPSRLVISLAHVPQPPPKMPSLSLCSLRGTDGSTLIHAAQAEPDLVDFLVCGIVSGLLETDSWTERGNF
jgi:hypothetical protein